jgi:hypothetical protein
MPGVSTSAPGSPIFRAMTKTPNERLDHKVKTKGDEFSEEETIARAEAALKRMLATPHRSHEEMKVGRKKRVVESSKSDSTKEKVGRRPSSKHG